jgi:hypothetical protein
MKTHTLIDIKDKEHVFCVIPFGEKEYWFKIKKGTYKPKKRKVEENKQITDTLQYISTELEKIQKYNINSTGIWKYKTVI